MLDEVIDELRSLDIQGDQMEDESGFTRSIIEEIHSSDIQGDQMEGECGVTQSIIDERHSWDIQGDEMESESSVTRSINMNFILRISKQIKYKVKVVLLQVSLMNVIFGYPRRSNVR